MSPLGGPFLRLGVAREVRGPAVPSATPAPPGRPYITSLSVGVGPVAGGTAFTITGASFVDGATVTIDGESCTSVVVVNSTTITAVSPARPSDLAGVVNVVVTNPDTQDSETDGNGLWRYTGRLFISEWSTATGSGDAAVRDTGLATPWALGTTASDLSVEVAPGASPGFTNALRVARKTGAVGNKWCQVQNVWALPEIGESLFFRAYIYVNMATLSATEDSHHPVESAYSGAWTSGYTIKMSPNGDGTFRLRLNAPGIFTKSDGAGVRDMLTNAQWYRLEWMLTRTATNTYTVLFRIYDNVPSLWGDPTVNIRRYTGPAYPIMNTVNTGLTMTDAEVRKFRIGSNGGTWANAGDEYYYWGGVEVRNDDWVGAY